MNEALTAEIERLVHNATRRREGLLLFALQKTRLRKAVSVCSGALALLSAGAIAAVLAHILGEQGTQVLAAVTAAVSGILSLLTATYFNDDDAFKMFGGAARYLALRDSAHRLLIDPGIDPAKAYALLGDLQTQYAQLEETYAHLFYPQFMNQQPPDLHRWLGQRATGSREETVVWNPPNAVATTDPLLEKERRKQDSPQL